MGKRTKIICTMGPAVDDEAILAELISQGADVCRLNFSHGSHDEHACRIEKIKKVRAVLGTPTAIMLDTKGPEIRTGLLEGGKPVELMEGTKITLTPNDVLGTKQIISQSAPILADYVSPGVTILLDDGLIELEVTEICGKDIVCRVVNSGLLGQRKSLNVPGVSVPLPALTKTDKADIAFGIEQGIDFVALSFVKDAKGVNEAREYINSLAKTPIGIISKIENESAVANIDEIIQATDAVMVARGDLGVEVPSYEVPHLQKSIIKKCNHEHKPVVIATQMLESMTNNPRATRAETTDVANAIYDGADCVMLSGETAAGKYPIEAVRTMAKIAETSEMHYLEDSRVRPHEEGLKSVSHAVGTAAVQTALDVDAKCIICPTMTGRSARLISSLRPPIPIYAVTPNDSVERSMQLFWGVTPLRGDVQGNMRSVIQNAEDVVMANGLIQIGDIAVVTCGDRFTSPTLKTADGKVDRFSPANVMYVVEIRDKDPRLMDKLSPEDALLTSDFFDIGSTQQKLW